MPLNTSVVQAEWEIQKQSRIEEHLLLWYAEVHTGTYITIISCCNVGLLLAISLRIRITDLSNYNFVPLPCNVHINRTLKVSCDHLLLFFRHQPAH